MVLPSVEAHRLKKPFPGCQYLLLTLTILKTEMKFNKHYEMPLKAKATRCPGPLTVTRMLDYKDTKEKHASSKAGQTLIWINLARNI